jgi:hypothetical protein
MSGDWRNDLNGNGPGSRRTSSGVRKTRNWPPSVGGTKTIAPSRASQKARTGVSSFVTTFTS